jgi:hypothetical protein
MHVTRTKLGAGLLGGLGLLVSATNAQPFAMTASAIMCGGTTTPLLMTPFTLASTIGDPCATATVSAGPYSLGGGFLLVAGGGPPPCYANCDGSTSSPTLTVNDFICFQSRFAAGDPYANCDGSTTSPTLTVNDFICFQAAFAAGCR